MTQTPPESPQRPPGTRRSGPRVSGEQMRDLSRLRRSTTDRKVAGVAGGLGRHLDVDPTVLRVLFVVLAFFGGAGLLLYAAGWLLLPDDTSDQAPIHTSSSTRTVILVMVGVVAFGLLVGRSWGGIGFPWPLIVIGAIAFLVLRERGVVGTRSDRSDATGDAAQPQAQGQPQTGGRSEPTAPEHTDPWTPTATGYEAPATYPVTDSSGTSPMPATPHGYRDIAETQTTTKTRKRERRGPVLFLPTLLLVGVGLGLVALYEAFVADLNDVYYPATALGVIGLMLVVGAFVGRTGGLIALGLVSALVVGTVAVAGGRWTTTVDEVPTTARELRPSYQIGVGEARLDLTGIANPGPLDGRTVTVDGRAGRIMVIVPDDVTVHVDAKIDGAGQIDVAGHRTSGGNEVVQSRTLNAGPSTPELSLDLHLRFAGSIEVETR